MASDYDPTEFVDSDFQAQKNPHSASAAASGIPRAPTREEMDSRVAQAHQKLAELKRAQEELERERSALEETRRRQNEFQTGRQEAIHNLTRGLGLLEEAEFNARRDAEQMAKTLADFRDALSKVEAINEGTWSTENFNVELTRALTAIENARMEWNAARLKFPLLSGEVFAGDAAAAATGKPLELPALLAGRGFFELCKVGLALTWPLVLLAIAILLVLLFRR